MADENLLISYRSKIMYDLRDYFADKPKTAGYSTAAVEALIAVSAAIASGRFGLNSDSIEAVFLETHQAMKACCDRLAKKQN